jgi:GH35 family endo-1,4-beta-xylanase
MRPAFPVPVRRTTVRVLATLVAAVLATTLLPTASARAKTVSFDKRLFGMHDNRLASLSRPMTGSIRLWDMGVTWAEIETSPGSYNFGRLDQIVRAAMARKVEVTLVLGITPSFYGASTNVNNDTVRNAYRAYVRAVMERYRNFEGKATRWTPAPRSSGRRSSRVTRSS